MSTQVTPTQSRPKASPFAPIEDALAAIARGELVVVVDDADRENEGDVIMAAELVTAEQMAFIVRCGGLVCVALEGQRLDELSLPLMVPPDDNSDAQGTSFTVSVDARHGTTTGISAADRALTVKTLIDPATVPNDLRRPGHVFPLRARRGGVLKRSGHTEAAVDLARLAGLRPAGVLCEVVKPDGTMARVPDLIDFCAEHGLLLISIDDIVRYRHRTERLVKRVSSATIPTEWGSFDAVAFESILDGEQHLAFVAGDPTGDEPVLVRVHSECLTGDVFGSRRCDCGTQLAQSMDAIARAGRGVCVYLRGQEGRGIGIAHKLRAYGLQDQGADTVDANIALGLPVDDREYGIGAQILADLGVGPMRLMTNNPAKYTGLEGFGLTISERVPLAPTVTAENLRYLKTKRERMGHHLDGLDAYNAEGLVDRDVPPATGGTSAG